MIQFILKPRKELKWGGNAPLVFFLVYFTGQLLEQRLSRHVEPVLTPEEKKENQPTQDGVTQTAAKIHVKHHRSHRR